jgi:transposase
VSEVYLKNENLLAALSILIAICLLIYSLAERYSRKILIDQNAHVINPSKKADLQTFDETGILLVQECQASLGTC